MFFMKFFLTITTILGKTVHEKKSEQDFGTFWFCVLFLML